MIIMITEITCDRCDHTQHETCGKKEAISRFRKRGWTIGGDGVAFCPACRRRP